VVNAMEEEMKSESNPVVGKVSKSLSAYATPVNGK
jgi:hypothetical protein